MLQLRIVQGEGGLLITFPIKVNVKKDITGADASEPQDNPGVMDQLVAKYGEIKMLVDELKDEEAATTFESQDAEDPTEWTDVSVLLGEEEHSGLFSKISAMFKNIRYLHKQQKEMLDSIDKLKDDMPEIVGSYEILNTSLPATAALTVVLEHTVEKAGIYQAQLGMYGHAATETRLLAAVNIAGHQSHEEVTRSGYYGFNAILTWECVVGDVIKCSYYSSVAQSVKNNNINATIIKIK